MKRILIAGLMAAAALAAQAAVPTHLYQLNTASDSLGGPALVSLGGSFGVSAYGQVGYSFDANQGVSVASAVSASVYTIDFSFAFDETNGYRRLVDFKDLSSDTGLYVLNGALNFFNEVTGPAIFLPHALARVTITRDAAGLVSGYVNGVIQFNFDDSSLQLAVFSGPSQIAYLFRDDNAVGNEASSGFADYIRIYDSALSGNEVAALPSPVPEPVSLVLLLGGLAAIAWRGRRAA